MKRTVPIELLLALAVGLMACTGGGSPPATATAPSQVRVTTRPTATPSPSANFRILAISARDGTALVGAYYPAEPAPAPGVLLLHMAGSQKESWAPFATRLQEAGYAALALDLRGHGESGGESEWAAMPDDVAEAWAALIAQPEVDAHPGAIVGAGVGANLALIAAADEPTVLAAALLSPELEEWGLEIEEAMVAYGERPILIVASQDDLPAAESAQRLAEMARGSPALALYPGAGHGTDIFGSQPDLANLILSWLRTHLSS